MYIHKHTHTQTSEPSSLLSSTKCNWMALKRLDKNEKEWERDYKFNFIFSKRTREKKNKTQRRMHFKIIAFPFPVCRDHASIALRLRVGLLNKESIRVYHSSSQCVCVCVCVFEFVCSKSFCCFFLFIKIVAFVICFFESVLFNCGQHVKIYTR